MKGLSDFSKLSQVLQTELENYEVVTLANVEHKDTIISGLEWLLQHRNTEGFWGERNLTSTSMAIMVLQSWSNISLADCSTEMINERCRQSVQWIRSCFESGWGQFPRYWIRGISLYAVHKSGLFDEFYEKEARRLFKEASANLSAIDHETAHHYARIIRLLDAIGMHNERDELSTPFSEFVVSIENPAIFSPYFLGEIVMGCRSLGNSQRTSIEERVQKIIRTLESYVGTAKIDSWSFVPYCAALIALGEEEKLATSSLLRDTYFKIFRQGGRRNDGSFYSDVQKTCWALLTLQRVREVHRISLPLYTFRSRFVSHNENIKKSVKAIRFSILLGLGSTSMLLLILIAWIILDLSSPLPSNVIAWIMGALVIAIGTRSFILLKRLLQ